MKILRFSLMVSLAVAALTVQAQSQPVAAEVAQGKPAQSKPAQQITPAQRAKAEKAAKAAMLQRIYNMRVRFEQERAAAENQARANVRLATDTNYRHIDAPTVSAYRQQTNQQLSRFEQQFRCLDVDVEANSGNTVVICGDNSGDISGRNISAERDIVTIQGGTP